MVEYKLFNRDLSWLSFNYRVLDEAKDKTLPLYERIKFLAIYSNNLDEFFKVRVASYRSLSESPDVSDIDLTENPKEILTRIIAEVEKQQVEFGGIFIDEIIPELRSKNIVLYTNENDFLPTHVAYTEHLFNQEILPYLQPILLSKGNILSFLQDNKLYLAIRLYKKKEYPQNILIKGNPKYAILKVPKHRIDRFLTLPDVDGVHYIAFLEDIVKRHMYKLFPGFEIDSSYNIKLSRNADFQIEDEFKGNLVEKIKEALLLRKTGLPARFLYDVEMPKKILKLLMQVFNLSQEDLVEGSRYHSFSDFFSFPNPIGKEVLLENIMPLPSRQLDRYSSVFDAIDNDDYMLHFPYHSYDYVIRFLNEAALDPRVEEIKATQYRVATNSAVVSSLIGAALNGKKVTVFVEVKARFDEQSNINFLQQMRSAGITVLTSIPKIKVHAKLALVTRKVGREGKKKQYVFISTGNFNEKTAKIYADHGLFTSNTQITAEVEAVFKYLNDQTFQFKFEHLFVAQFNLREKIKDYIDREREHVRAGREGRIILKMNGLEDPKMIKRLYEASEEGVKIDLIIRGICCLVPNQPYSKNIRVLRIVDRFLEHARVFVFFNDGKYDIYISSADFMKRNLYRRVECTVPIYSEKYKQEILDILSIQLKDNVKGTLLNEKLENIRIQPKENELIIQSQMETYRYLAQKEGL